MFSLANKHTEYRNQYYITNGSVAYNFREFLDHTSCIRNFKLYNFLAVYPASKISCGGRSAGKIEKNFGKSGESQFSFDAIHLSAWKRPRNFERKCFEFSLNCDRSLGEEQSRNKSLYLKVSLFRKVTRLIMPNDSKNFDIYIYSK